MSLQALSSVRILWAIAMYKTRKIHLGCQIVIDMMFCFMLIYWTGIAIKKYVQQPISTHAIYTRGDDDEFIVFPQITFCHGIPPIVHQDCVPAFTEDFVTYVHRCFKEESLAELNMDEYRNRTKIDVSRFVLYASFRWNESTIFRIEDMFHNEFHHLFGACVEFDGDNLRVPVREADRLTQLYFELDFSHFGPQIGEFFSSLKCSNQLPSSSSLQCRIFPCKI